MVLIVIFLLSKYGSAPWFLTFETYLLRLFNSRKLFTRYFVTNLVKIGSAFKKQLDLDTHGEEQLDPQTK